jgi:hypothetical protein
MAVLECSINLYSETDINRSLLVACSGLLPKSPGFNLNMCELQSSGAVKLSPARPGSASIGASVAVTTAADLARPATVCGNTTGVSSDRERHT